LSIPSSIPPLQRSEIAGLESKLGEARAQLSSYATSLHHRDRELASAVQFATQTVRGHPAPCELRCWLKAFDDTCPDAVHGPEAVT
jgi:hypothetical protein